MINFIPKAFTGKEDNCPVCTTRLQLELAMTATNIVLSKLVYRLVSSGMTAESVYRAHSNLLESFSDMHSAYRLAFGINLAIWFSAERYGRTKKIPDLLYAYDEYQAHLLATLATFKQCYNDFQALLPEQPETISELNHAYIQLLSTFADYLKEVEKWTERRKEEAFKVI